MKILYGVQATGNGHISRSREIIRCLKERGHDVFVNLSGRDPATLWDMDEFRPYRTFKGLTFSTHKGRIKYFETLFNIDIRRFFTDIGSFDASGYDIAITDFEPVTSRIASKHKIPLIGIGHQYAFYSDIPTRGSNPVTSYIIRHFAPVDYPLGLHWYHFNKAILPPVVPMIDKNELSNIESKIVVYLPFEEREDIIQLLRPYSDYNFFVYHKVELPEVKENIRILPFSRDGFLHDLKECGGVISNAGFELVSEALTIGKKILIKPLSGQMEQLSNAKAISMLNLGLVMERLDRAAVKDFLHKPMVHPVNYPNVAEIIADVIDNGSWADMERTFRSAWTGVNIF